ncbi:MAG: hypothetical protein UU69_C0014G0026 [Candidatus Magasanikbacteria bacterium GW2011_GWA2_41_55]|uniref:Uncharacterized protein n=1 Tax=Candidatus Magasanikbacteria bacterium GW2011_GWA2_41_55 TaxID=1619038 RepID=A0A0G0WLY6_9BACT|nr:MAG: hypothetical protein UU69_C0014G0026 [Candidatus Magasanikbacteria bacterium GW2011_GWA2_41_55]
MSYAIDESLQIGKILKKIDLIFSEHLKDNILKISNKMAPHADVCINLTGHELGRIKSALRDYLTLRIANIVDNHPAALSIKNFKKINLEKLRNIPEINRILEARNNWIGHINPRYIGPATIDDLYSDNIVCLLETLLMLISTDAITES